MMKAMMRTSVKLKSAHDEVVQLADETRHREGEGAREDDCDPDVDDDDAKRSIERGALVDPVDQGRQEVRHGPRGDEDDDDVRHARQDLGEIGEDLEGREDDEQHDERRDELPLARREIHRRMVLTEYHASPCRTRAPSWIATRRISRSPTGHPG